MKKAKKLVALTTAAVMAASMLTACGGGSSSSTATQAPADTAAAEGGASGDAAASGDYEEIELVFSHINAETHTWHKMAEKFKELIEERSGGKITVTIYPNNQLGSEIETVQSAIAGMGDCDIVLTGESMQTYVEELGIIGMPYAITSDEHMDAVLEGDVGKELEDLMLQAGLRSLGAVKRGPRYITSNKEIPHPRRPAGLYHPYTGVQDDDGSFRGHGRKTDPDGILRDLHLLTAGRYPRSGEPVSKHLRCFLI